MLQQQVAARALPRRLVARDQSYRAAENALNKHRASCCKERSEMLARQEAMENADNYAPVIPKVQLHNGGNPQAVRDNGVQTGAVSGRKLPAVQLAAALAHVLQTHRMQVGTPGKAIFMCTNRGGGTRRHNGE